MFQDSVPVQIEIMTGDPAHVVAYHAAASGVDLIVAGRHRQRPTTDIFSGRTVERLLRQSRQPVLVVNNLQQSPYECVLLPVDFSIASRAAVQFVASLLPKAKLHLVHAYKGPFQDYVAMLSLAFNRQERGRFAGSMGEHAGQAMAQLIEELLETRQPDVTVENREVVELVEEVLGKRSPALVAMGTHARTGLEHALIGSVAESVLRTDFCDVLVVPARS